MLSDKQVAKFQKIYKERFGKDLSKKEALAEGVQLLRLFQVVYQPITKSQLQVLEKKRKEEKELDACNVEQAELTNKI